MKLDHKAKTANEEVPFDSDGDGIFAAGDDLPQMDKWLVDSGASSHMTTQREFLTNYRKFDVPEKVGLGDGRIVEDWYDSIEDAIQSQQSQTSSAL